MTPPVLAPPDRSDPNADARDRGLSLVEMLVSVSMIGIVMAAVSTAVIVLVSNGDATTDRVATAQDTRQLVNYVPGDVRSSTPELVEIAPPGGSTTPSQCPGVPGSDTRLHLAMTSITGLTRIEYRTGHEEDGTTLRRWSCRRDEPEGSFDPATSTRVADGLDPDDPVTVTWAGERLAVGLRRPDGDVASLAATPFRPDDPLPSGDDEDDDEDTPVATHCPANPNELNEGFMVLTEGDVRFHNGADESYGPVAVGGDLTFKNYNSSTQSGGTFFAEDEAQRTALLVEGMVNWPDSGGGYLRIYNGYLHVGDIANWDPAAGGPSNQLRLTAASGPQNRQIRVIDTDQTFESVERSGLLDFGATFTAMRGIGTALEELPGSCEGITELELFGQNGEGEWSGGDVWLYFEPGKATVLTMTMAEYGSIGNVNLVNGSAQPTQDTPLIINIVDSGDVTMPPGETDISRNHVPYVLWNFPHATQITTTGTFWGGILAPNAVVVQQGDIRGNVIAGELQSHDGIISLQAFEGDFPWLSPAE